MRPWIMIVIWLTLGVAFAAVMTPLVGLGRAAWIPVGWLAGGVLGGLGGAVFTLRSRRREVRLKRTLATAIGAAMTAVLVGVADAEVFAGSAPSLWKLGLALAGVLIVAPACVVVSFWINETLA